MKMLNVGFKFQGSSLQYFSPELVPLKLGAYKFPMEVLVDITGGKKIIKTAVSGMSGTVKELIGFDDYKITVHAIIHKRTYDDVTEELEKLITEWEKERSISINCPKTDIYGISRVVWGDFSHPESAGEEGTERMTINLVSDDDYDFEVEY